MKFSVRWISCALAVAFVAGLSACGPSSLGLSDDEKDPHYLEGRSLANAMDYKGAVDAFNKALRADPDSAPAHIELALLYDDKVRDPAAAIYHYQRYLALRPRDPQAGWIQQRVENCKQDLAKTVLLPVPPGMQRDIQQLYDENKRLTDENQRLQALLASRGVAVSNSAPPPNGLPVQTPMSPAAPQTGPTGSAARSGPVASNPGRSSPGTAGRAHTVESGETPIAIARKYGIHLDALMAANPNLDARHMKVGQTLVIPPGGVPQ